MSKFFVSALVLIFLVVVQRGATLQCWHCSSDLDPQCVDPFNTNYISTQRGGSIYDSNNNNQRNYNDQRNSDPNYNNQRNYDSQRDYNNQNYRSSQFDQQSRGSPQYTTCKDEEARLRRMKNVCLKKVQKSSSNYVTVIRRCEMVAFDREVGTCYDPVSRGMSLEACEYCDYDGCNAATGLKTNIFLASLIPVTLLYLFLNRF